jgi:hypothetical protein
VDTLKRRLCDTLQLSSSKSCAFGTPSCPTASSGALPPLLHLCHLRLISSRYWDPIIAAEVEALGEAKVRTTKLRTLGSTHHISYIVALYHYACTRA